MVLLQSMYCTRVSLPTFPLVPPRRTVQWEADVSNRQEARSDHTGETREGDVDVGGFVGGV